MSKTIVEIAAKKLAESFSRGIKDGSLSVDRLAYLLEFLATQSESPTKVLLESILRVNVFPTNVLRFPAME